MRLAPKDSTVKRLFALSGNCCAFPGCNQTIVENETVVGVICHIEAAEPGGERYNLQQTDEERRDFDNQILLCGTHHTLTDDMIRYPVERLCEMKSRHEEAHRAQQYHASDDVVHQALNRFNIVQANVNQGGNQYNIINHGLDAAAVTQLFSTLFEANFPRLQEIAQRTARENVEVFRQEFLNRANETLKQEDLHSLSDPDIQFVLKQAIETIARRNTPETRKTLTALLIERIRMNTKERAAILLDEAILTSGKITVNQVKLLGLSYIINNYLRSVTIGSWTDLNTFFQDYVGPFLNIGSDYIDSIHLTYAGCANISEFNFSTLV